MSQPRATPDLKRPAALVFAGAAGLYLFHLGQAGLYDLDESVYAEIAREMAKGGDWVTPHLDFIPYLEKPPLLDWLNSLSFLAFGYSAFTARLVTALAALAGIGLVYTLGRDLWGRRAGLAAAAVLATSFGYFIFGRMAMPDLLFAVLVTAALSAFLRALLGEGRSLGPALLGYGAMGLAVLTKGLIGAVFPVLTVGLFLLAARAWPRISRLHLLPGAAVFLLVAAPWHVLASLRNPGFFEFYFVNEHIRRFLGHRQLVNFASLPVPTFLGITLGWLCPWSLFLPAALQRCWPRRGSGGRGDDGMRFLLLWAASVVGFFVISSVRLEYYALPALPPLALLLGRFWDLELSAPPAGPRSRAVAAAWIALAISAVALVPAAALFPRLEHRRFYNLFPDPIAAAPYPPEALRPGAVDAVPGFARLVPLLEGVVALILAGTGLSAWAWFRRRPGAALVCLATATAAGLVAVERGFVLFAPYRSVAALAAAVRAELRPGDQLLMEGKYERHAGFGFYTGRPIRLYHGFDGVLVYGSRYADAGSTFVSDEEFSRLWRGRRRAFLLTDAADGFARLRRMDPATQVGGRAGGTWLFVHDPSAPGPPPHD